MNVDFEKIKNYIENNTCSMVELEKLLTSIPALAPENGGEGEEKKCAALEKWLLSNGIKNLKHYDAPDSRVPAGFRPNLVAEIPGEKNDFCIWVCAHLDVVPVGELSMWNTNPWQAVEKDGKIFGRGVEDNQQGLCSGVLAALSFVRQNIVPAHTLKLLFMADEEVGSKYGMNFLIENHKNIFGADDRILIPDGGDPLGQTIEVAEKSILWLKFHIIGKQAHGSRPDQGCNAKLASSYLALKVHELEKLLNAHDKMFEPSRSTFEPTMQYQNVSGVNIIPGDDVFCADCRILPQYSLDQVRAEVNKVIRETEESYGVKIQVEELQAEQSKATSVESHVAKELFEAIKNVHGVEPRFVGIGGGTVAAGLRNAGIDAVVWSTMDELAHQPNEYAIVKNIAKDALTIAYMVCR
ncbi:MAG: M20 family metallo-hydrolase [Treponema succinifaciens]|uniref:M20 family metallo-hydrolase n=1 Tax=Treponema TaxID=157 RepID=UPI0023534EE6|nr:MULTISPECIES: M20 family metallo-hydrolase [Treponema]MCI6911983.1 M20 family metallo-hydrolase [Treponema succinifaciens]